MYRILVEQRIFYFKAYKTTLVLQENFAENEYIMKSIHRSNICM